MSRKIIQFIQVRDSHRLTVLCDDGSVWWLNGLHQRYAPIKWERVPSIPQDDEIFSDEQTPDIDRLDISTRIRNQLVSEGIDTVKKLSELSAVDCLKLPNIGKGSLASIQAALVGVGLHLSPYRG